MHFRELIVPAALVFVVAACAPERGPIGHLTFPGERGTEYRITPDGLSNARVNVSRVEGGKAFRGIIDGNKELEIRVEGDQLKGERAGNPISIMVVQQGNEIIARGMYGGQGSTIHILREAQGSCAFRFDEREHKGANSCASQNSIVLPAFMTTWTPQEQALFITIAFAELYGVARGFGG